MSLNDNLDCHPNCHLGYRLNRHLLFSVLLACGIAQAGGIRDHTRPAPSADTQVSEVQAQVLSLALAEVTTHQLQSWVRLAGQIDNTGKILLTSSCLADAALVKTGQRVIAFPPGMKSSISQGRVSRVSTRKACVRIEAVLAAADHEPGRFYVMEIIVPRGRFLAIPKEAIIEEEDRSLVYIHTHAGHYLPRVIHPGLKGERYTRVLHGLKTGEHVVTVGSFFIHAQHQLDERQTNKENHAQHIH
ncbi:MAG: hypothetical protein GXP18_06575 [Gammaproteobacteria bacterium]|nr:hypothetical protein [Gammaproteobacteria bacterium]